MPLSRTQQVSCTKVVDAFPANYGNGTFLNELTENSRAIKATDGKNQILTG